MKILLLNSPWINDEKLYGIKAGTRWPEVRKKDRTLPYFPFPYEMACTVPYLRKFGIQAHMKDAIAEELGSEECLKYLEGLKPDLTVIEAFPTSLKADLAFARDAKKRTGTKIAFCGAHADSVPEETLKNDEVDFVLYGEYEEALRDMAPILEKGQEDFSSVKGLAYKRDGRIILGSKRPPIANVDEIPVPDYSELPFSKYNEPLSRYYPSARIMTTRSCPYACPFCVVPVVHGQGYRRRSIDLVMKEIGDLVRNYGVREIYFDDAFVTIPRAKEIAEALLKQKFRIAWSSWMDWNITAQDVALLKKSGCYALKFGIESSNADIVKSIGKPVYLEKLRKNIKIFRKMGMLVHGSFILGMPGETRQSLRDTLDIIFSVGLTSCQVSVATPLPGTPFYKEAVEKGWLTTTDWSQYEGTSNPVMNYPECSQQDLADALDEVARRKVKMFLRNPVNVAKYFWKLLKLKGVRGFCAEIVKKGGFAARAFFHKN